MSTSRRPRTAASALTRRAALGATLAALLTAAHLSNDAVTSLLYALLPILQGRFASGEVTLALLVATFAFSSSVTQPLFGAVGDRLGRRALAGFGLILSVSLLGLLAVAPSLPAVFALLLVGGLGSAAFHPAATSLARGWRERTALAVSLFSAGGMVGLALGPVAVVVLSATLGLAFTPWLMLPGVLFGVVILLAAGHPDRPAHTPRVALFDRRVLLGPVGQLTAAGTLLEVAFVTFTAAMPLWLVSQHGIARDAPLIGWTLATFYVAAALGGVTAGWLGRFVARRHIFLGAMPLALVPLLAVFAVPPGSVAFFAAVAASGALVNAAFPLLVVTAQDLAPEAEATAAGMVGGLTVGVAGVLYVGVGALQGLFGLQAAMSLSYLALVPAALLCYLVVRRHPGVDARVADLHEIVACACSGCGNANVCLCAEGRLCRSAR